MAFFKQLNPFQGLPSADEFLAEHEVGMNPALATKTDKITTLAIKQKLLSLTGQSMTIKDKDGKTWAKIDGKVFSMRDRCVIEDVDGNPVCCIIEKVLSMSFTYFVYSFKPYYDGQQPTPETQDGKPLYAWAKIWQRLVAITEEYSICMAVGDNEYQEPEAPLFKAKAPSMTSPKLQVCARADQGGRESPLR